MSYSKAYRSILSERLHNTVLSNKLCGGLGMGLRHWLTGRFFISMQFSGKFGQKNRLSLVSEILVVVFLSSVDAKN